MYMLCRKGGNAGSSLLEENMTNSYLAMSCFNSGYVLYM